MVRRPSVSSLSNGSWGRGVLAWDWVKLLLLPVLLPIVVIPLLSAMVQRSLTADPGPAAQAPLPASSEGAVRG